MQGANLKLYQASSFLACYASDWEQCETQQIRIYGETKFRLPEEIEKNHKFDISDQLGCWQKDWNTYVLIVSLSNQGEAFDAGWYVGNPTWIYRKLGFEDQFKSVLIAL